MAALPEIKLNVNAENLALGTVIKNYFEWGNYGLLKYDKVNNEILLNEGVLMTLIKMVNPAQLTRGIKLLSEDEWLDFK